MSSSNLDKEGLYDQTRRYKFNNIGDEEYVGMWNSKVFVTVPPGESVTLPEAQAITFAKDLCTRVMLKEEKARFVPNMYEPTWEMSQRSRAGIPLARDPYEKRILQAIEEGQETPELQALRSQIREEVMADLTATVSTEPPRGPSSVSDLSLVKDKRTAREGHEFEGLTALK